MECFKKASLISPKSELASLGVYLCYADVDEDDLAINEMFSYLEKYPADSHKVTLEELLEGLEKGNMENYRSEIEFFAKKNSVKLQ